MGLKKVSEDKKGYYTSAYKLVKILATTAFLLYAVTGKQLGPTLALSQLDQCYQWVLTLPKGLKTLKKQHQKCSQGIFWERLTLMSSEM